ncbi:MAG: protease pro-enzyme activation domain-containing protein [Streptosporangiaceae bacterium]
MGVALTAGTGAFASAAAAAPASAGPQYVTVRGGADNAAAAQTGQFSSSRMSVEVALAPRHAAQLNRELRAVYTRGSAQYHHWLAKGQFDARYAPSGAKVAAYLRASGLTVTSSSSPFLVRATGSSAKVAAAFRTSFATFRSAAGERYFANASAVRMPRALASGVIGVIGLNNMVREHNSVQRPTGARSTTSAAATKKCETPYVTRKQLFDAVNKGIGFPYGYGGGPGCSGLTPSQTNSLYGAPNAGRRGKGAGVSLAVFELSAYQASDIRTWAHEFYGPSYSPPLVNKIVDGGPLHPICPAGDTCPPSANGYAGDIEVDADIETQLAMSPDAAHIIVYNAPNDETGQTELDEYTRIADDDAAAVVSSSWASCENVLTGAYVQTENVVFEEMALQGQSVFSSAGDTGAFECLRSNGTTLPNVLDPASQPWVTSVGGTSFAGFNPGATKHPAYPRGTETVWNVDNLCNTKANEGGTAKKPLSGYFWCAETGAGGGGNSQYWGRPWYQHGRGINNRYTTHGNGTTQCALAAKGTPCREEPDVSANADEYTPYAEYCTGSSATPYSVCATINTKPHGWFGIGGTSLSSPLWSGIIADRDSYMGGRTGNINPMVYALYRQNPGRYFHDIVATRQSTNNGLFPSVPGFDLATGIGTPKMAAIITGR